MTINYSDEDARTSHGRLLEWHRDFWKVVELYLIWRAEKWCRAKI